MKPKLSSKATLAMLTVFVCTMFFGCVARPDSTSDSLLDASVSERTVDSSELAVDSSALIEQTTESKNILLGVDLTHPDDADRTARTTIYMLFVMQDGIVLSTEYCNDKDYDFLRKKSQCDPDIWNHMEPARELGKLSETELSKLTEAIAGTDTNAGWYDRSSDEETPLEVQENYEISYDLYIPGQSSVYAAYCFGEENGVVFRSNDTNAMEAVHLIQETDIYQQWLQNYL